MKFANKCNAGGCGHSIVDPQDTALSREAAKKRRYDDEDDIDFDGGRLDDDMNDDFDADDDIDSNLLDQFDDEIEGVDLADLDLDEFADEFDDNDLDDDFDDDDEPHSRSKRRGGDDDEDVYDEEIDDSDFYNDEFKDFDNYTTISDFDDDLDTYIENEGGGYYDDYDSRY